MTEIAQYTPACRTDDQRTGYVFAVMHGSASEDVAIGRRCSHQNVESMKESVMQKTNIDYLDYTWNPIAMRCTPVSPGCANCWHLQICDRHAKNPRLPECVRKAKAGNKPVLLRDELECVLDARKTGRIGVQFMGDLFHEDVPIDIIETILEMAAVSDHAYLFLTKRIDRMQDIYLDMDARDGFYGHPSIWLGVTCENQKWADKRIPELLKIPAAVRWLSLEPLLGPIDLAYHIEIGNRYADGDWLEQLDWIVVGCESGPGRRPCKLQWVRDIVQQCKAANVPVFVKQVEINGKVSHDPSQWPEDLRIREFPNG